jgi:UDP-N-acetylmuramoyl-tripeptide--D-alanyl-D-alanine ligase
MRFSVKDIIEATGGKLISGEDDIYFSDISIDSRTIKNGELFIALKGKNFDGHDFIDDAFNKGAIGALINKGSYRYRIKDKVIITIPDTLKGLGAIGRYIRNGLSIPVIGITGSNGKTTTKEIVAKILESSYKVLKNPGNLNNLIGLPLTLFRYTDEDIIIVELGINQPDEMRRLIDISLPTIALITNINIAHLENLKNIDNVAYEKGKIFRSLKDNDIAVVNIDDPLISRIAEDIICNKVTYGIESKGDINLIDILKYDLSGMKIKVSILGKEEVIEFSLYGKHNIYNVLASIAISKSLGIETEVIKERVKDLKGYPMRMQILKLSKDIYVINDAYNANPKSMEYALKSLFELKRGGRCIAVLGDMLELGDFSENAHRKIGTMVSSLDYLFLMGDYSHVIADSACSNGMAKDRIFIMDNHRDIAYKLLDILNTGDFILIKGSRALSMDKVVDILIETFGVNN